MRSLDELRAGCARVLRGNDRERHGRRYSVPSPGLPAHQRAWDSAFIAIGWAHLGETERAFEELRSLLDAAWTDGRVPRDVFHDPAVDDRLGPALYATDGPAARDAGCKEPRSSSITHPPVFAQCAARVVEVSGARCPPELLLKIDRYHRWCGHDRDPEGWNLVAVAHPWESGMDDAPRWDARDPRDLARAIAADGFGPGPFAVYDPAPSALFALDLRALADLADGQTAADARASAREVERGLERLWDEALGRYRCVDVSVGVESIPARPDPHGVGGYLPLLLDGHRAERMRDGLHRHFATAAPLPSTAPGDPAFAPRGWRGATWVNINWLFRHHVAGLRERTLDLVRAHGCWEYYDPHSGAPLGAPDFGWTAALTLDLLAG